MSEDTEDQFQLYIDIAKAAPDGSFVRGWACLTTNEDGHPNTDWDGELMPLGVLAPAVYDFMGGERVAKVMHDGKQTGAIVEAVVVDDDFAREMGMTTKKRGVWMGMQVHDPVAKERVRKRELKGFSIGGRGVLVDV
jgi:hypothetical protein